LSGILHELPQPLDTVLQGELYWRLEGHVQAEAGSANARGIVAGLMARKQLSDAGRRHRPVRLGLAEGRTPRPNAWRSSQRWGLPTACATAWRSPPLEAAHWRQHWYRSPCPSPPMA
jgi:DNA ligase (NAD+)